MKRRSWKLAFSGDIAFFLHCSILASLKYEQQLLNTIIASEETGWKNFYNLKLRLHRKYLRNRRVVSGLFLAGDLHMCAWLLNSLLNWHLLFSGINLDVSNLRNRNIDNWKENFGKSVWQRESKLWYITNRKRDLHVSFVNTRGRFVRRVNWNAEDFVDLTWRKLSLFSDRWKNCDPLVKLVVILKLA